MREAADCEEPLSVLLDACAALDVTEKTVQFSQLERQDHEAVVEKQVFAFWRRAGGRYSLRNRVMDI